MEPSFNSPLEHAKSAFLNGESNSQAAGPTGRAAGAGMTAARTLANSIDTMQHTGWPVGNMFSVKVVSTIGAGSGPVRVYIGNQDGLLNVTDNGSGPGSVAYTYTDALTAPGSAGVAGGTVTSRIMRYGLNGNGLPIFGVKFRFIVTATSAGDPSGLEACNPYFAQYSMYGTFTPYNITFPNDTRGDFDTSIEVAPGSVYWNAISQLSFIVPDGDTVTAQVMFTPNYKR